LEIQYHLQFCDIECACQLDDNASIVVHHGELLVEKGALVDFARSVAISIYEHLLVNLALTQNLSNNSKSVEIWKSENNEKCSKLDLLPTRIFPEFYSLPSYFPRAKI
jgi:hypothetical protein